MKKICYFIVLACTLVSCGSNKSTVQSSQPQQTTPMQVPSTNPFGGETYSMPTFEPDTEEYFAASGMARGSRERMDMLQRSALTNAQNLIRQKMTHAYEGMVVDYSKEQGNNNGTDMTKKIQTGGTQIIKGIVNETMARDVKFSGVDEKGYVTCFVGIRIYKKQMADKIAKSLSQDEELKLNSDEERFRKYMEEKLKEYKESNQ